MGLDLAGLNWVAVGVAVVVAQVISTVWFVVLFGDSWAREYGAADKKQHTAEIPGYTYPIQILCTVALTISLALLHGGLGVDGVGEALTFGVFVILGLVVSTGLPGQAFLKRWRVAALAYGSQAAMIVGISVVLGAWP